MRFDCFVKWGSEILSWLCSSTPSAPDPENFAPTLPAVILRYPMFPKIGLRNFAKRLIAFPNKRNNLKSL